ncbi:hypothetical protein DEJ31_15145 [Curtobacterium sp. MCPF17_031]|nr:hypothetical protein DEJ31_15145 [Curtobacterium sp. MCPF17_031]
MSRNHPGAWRTGSRPWDLTTWCGALAESPQDAVGTLGTRVQDDFLRSLLHARLGFSERLVGLVVAHLRNRRTGESTILLQQLVKAQLGEVAIEHLEIDALLASSTFDRQEALMVDRRITDVDRAVLRLFGASGYLRDDFALWANVSEQLLAYSMSPEEEQQP